ncbi:peptidylprolyl isomerase [uncultured Cytophaga sp.]|uniref:peptidylprolyl isomerase n=1 Tax=uncultured Cytophaga sp. TaxID=160238 RepID=UPI002619C3BF|nr:peptidylprolyl isomerase [uncultured Cytophaga sp.]
MRLPIWIVAATFSSVLIYSCATEKTATSSSKTTTSESEPTILKIGSESISTKDFAYVYDKNNGKSADAYTKASLDEYLNLYTKFKLRVIEAESLGLDTTEAFKQELAGYQKQLAQPYLTEKGVTEMLVKQAYDRMKEEIRASHILILCSPDADPKDTLIAFNKITAIRDKFTKGEDFGKLAAEYSEDPSAKNNKGDLGYFTALSMVYEFEEAAYATKVGSVSKPVRTKFGYHLVQVVDRRPSQGQIHVAHIMARYSEGMSKADSIAAKDKIEEIYKELQSGADWNVLCSEFSDDANSKANGGELQWFSTGKMIPSFENAAYTLNTPGQYSKPILTPYGWHIIKLIERKPLGTFVELEPSIRAKVTKDSRSDLNKKMLIARLKKENSFTENSKGIDYAISKADSSLLIGNWSFQQSDKNNITVFTINKDKYTAEDFFAYVFENQHAVKNTSPSTYMRNILYTNFVNASLIEYEEAHLPEKYVDYKMLSKEYHDGILLFQLMEERVWNKASTDTAGLRKYFNANNSKYTWGERAHAYIFSAIDQATLDKVAVDSKSANYLVKEQLFDNISFNKNVAAINTAGKAQLNKAIALLRKDKQYSLTINLSKDQSENASILAHRKDSIVAFIRNAGVSEEKIVFTYAANPPARKTEAQRQADRFANLQLFTTSKKYLETKYNSKTPLTLQVTEGMFGKNENELINKCSWMEGNCTFVHNNRNYLIVIDRIEQPRNKTFEESRGLVISDYQGYLESEWIKELKLKYPVEINQTELQKLVK